MSAKETKDAMASAMDRLAKAAEEYEAAETAESVARNNKTTAQNRLNDAQKAFDAIVKKLHDAAPRDTQWSYDKRVTKVEAPR